MNNKKKLTVKQKKFIECYAGNSAEAARLAGYSPKIANRIGAENMTKLVIKQAIQKRVAEQVNTLILDREGLQKFWTKIITDESLEYQHRLKASELLAKSNCLFTERHLHELSAGFSLIVSGS